MADNLDATYQVLRTMFARHDDVLVVDTDEPGSYYAMNTRQDGKDGKPQYFGGVRLGKRYVSAYLMPVYMFPDLLDGISPALRARMQGKSCFNLRTPDAPLVEELTSLTAASIKRMDAEHLL